jgi:hypothetical protein
MKTLIFLCAVLWSHFAQAVDYQEGLQRYALPENHTLGPALDRLFRSPKVLQNQANLEKAGFVVLDVRSSSLIIARHDALPGYLVKVYPHSRQEKEKHWENLINRCIGAENIRNLIKKEGLKYFTVPDKWLYLTPTEDPALVLVVTHMDILPFKKSQHVWKKMVTHQQLDELYCIISHGYGSSILPANHPYTKQGLFACIDTEKVQKTPSYNTPRKYLSKEGKRYWDELVRLGSVP